MIYASLVSSGVLAHVSHPHNTQPERRRVGDEFVRVETACGKIKTGAVAGWWLDVWGCTTCSSASLLALRHSTIPVRPRAAPRRRSSAGLSVGCVDAGSHSCESSRAEQRLWNIDRPQVV